MALHLLKLCVGPESVSDLERGIAHRVALARAAGDAPVARHTTRMVPKRVEELLDGGSLYWVIKGQLCARQKLVGIEPFTDPQGIGRCHLVLHEQVVPLHARPVRAFQGWRYLAEKDAPADLASMGADVVDMPDEMRKELRALGLL